MTNQDKLLLNKINEKLFKKRKNLTLSDSKASKIVSSVWSFAFVFLIFIFLGRFFSKFFNGNSKNLLMLIFIFLGMICGFLSSFYTIKKEFSKNKVVGR